MKSCPLQVVVTADQRRSRTNPDRVPEALASLYGVATVLPFERTAGDEIQALLDDPGAVVDVVERLTRLGGWRLGIGVGEVERPLPESTRAARGPAYVAAREAIGRAARTPSGLALELARASDSADPVSVSGVPYGDAETLAEDVEAALWLLRALWERRSEEGWEVVDLLDRGHSHTAAAAALGISASAVSQRHSRAHIGETTRGRVLATHLLQALLADGQLAGGQP